MAAKILTKDIIEAERVVAAAQEFTTPVKGTVKLEDVEKQLKTVQDIVNRLEHLRAEVKDLVDKKHDQGRVLMVMVHKLREEVGVQFGYDSNEYDMVGRKRTSERKRPGRPPVNNTA